MHDIEPYCNWLKYYDSSFDERSPFYGKVYNYDLYQNTIYGYYIDPGWDSIGSETLYVKILYVDYEEGFAVIEFIGEWNDAINNDIMSLKRNFIEMLQQENINRFILVGENIMNFHGSDDCYYEEWADEIVEEGGWIAALNFPEFVEDEMRRFRLGNYINMSNLLRIENWRTMHPLKLYEQVGKSIQRKLK